MADKFLITEEGKKKFEEELEYLKGTARLEIAARLKEAIAQGDLSENAEYEVAKDDQARNEGRISELEAKLRNCEVISADDGGNGRVVRIGSTVVVRDMEFKEDTEYTIVGSAEAAPAENKISNESPLGKAIIGQRSGKVVEVNAPVGIIKYKIVKIKKY